MKIGASLLGLFVIWFVTMQWQTDKLRKLGDWLMQLARDIRTVDDQERPIACGPIDFYKKVRVFRKTRRNTQW